MGFYSFVVIAPEEVILPEYFVHLDEGRNVFNASVSDIENLKKRLSEKGVRILQANQLDAHEPLSTEPEPYPDPFADEPLLSPGQV